MIPNLPLYINIGFIITTIVTIWLFQYIIKRGAFTAKTTTFLMSVLTFNIFFQGVLAFGGFYLKTDLTVQRILLIGILPALLTILFLFIFSRDWIAALPLNFLILISIIRVPVEIILYCLYQEGKIPQIMTFDGKSFDIISGLTAPIVYWLAFTSKKINSNLILIWNTVCLFLLLNNLVITGLIFQSTLQSLSYEQPNIAVLYFPFIWLPTLIFPVILFSHLAIYYKLLGKRERF